MPPSGIVASVTVPARLAVAVGSVSVWSAPALTVGAVFAAAFTVTSTVSVALNTPSAARNCST